MLYKYPVTKGTNGDKCPKCPLEEMGTNHLWSINQRFVPCRFVSLSFC
jgi:hypothetical protein